jgi:hypothetical protein
MVVTSPADTATQQICEHLGVRTHVTNAFYEKGAKFNKGKAMEEAFEAYGRTGWMLILDADIIIPKTLEYLRELRSGFLYGTYRKVLKDPTQWNPEYDPRRLRRERESEIPGFFQYFDCSDPVLSKRPWYDTTFAHAGGGDSYFQTLWSPSHKVKINTDVIHLGPRDANWYGRATPRIDGATVPEAGERKEMIERLQKYNGWAGHRKDKSVTFLNRVERSEFVWAGDHHETTTSDGNNPIPEQG